MKFSELIKLLNPNEHITIYTLDRYGEVTELFDGIVGETPHELFKFEVVDISVDAYVTNYPMRHLLRGTLVVTLDEVPAGYL